jgi:hypothetical protein
MAAITGLPSPGMDWREPIFKYLQLGTMSDDETETQHLVCRAKGYLIHNVELYHCSTSGILQQCIPVKEGKALLLDIHKGVYGHHASSRSMVGKVFWQGFYWWMANGDVAQIVRSCRGVPILCKTNPHSDTGSPDHPHYMVVCHVRSGPFGALQESARGLDPPTCCGRQVH